MYLIILEYEGDLVPKKTIALKDPRDILLDQFIIGEITIASRNGVQCDRKMAVLKV